MSTRTEDLTYRLVLDFVDHQTRPMLAAQRAQTRAIEQQRRGLAQAGGSLTRYAERQALAASKSTASYRRTGAAATTMGAETRRAGEQAARAASAQERAAIVAQRVGKSYRQEAIEARSLARAQGEAARATQHAARQATTRGASGRAAVGGAVRSAAGTLGLGVGFGAAAGIAGAVRQTVEFDKAMRNVQSITQQSDRSFQGLSKRVLALAGPTAQAPKTLAAGLYDLVSSGFNARQSMTILTSSARAATAGLTDTATSTKAMAAVLNAYHLPASQATKVSDELFQTVNRGVITFEDLSQNIGDVLPFASTLGINLRQVGASISTMTKEGISAPETMTRIKQVMESFIKPSKGMKGALHGLGVESGAQLVKQKGFQGALEAVVKTTGGSKEAIAKLFPNIRALGGAFALTGKNTRAAHGDLAAFEHSSGATSRALAEQSKSVSYQWNRLKATASAAGIAIGSRLVPFAAKGAAALIHLGQSFSRSHTAHVLAADLRTAEHAGQGFLAALQPAAPFVTHILLPALAGAGKIVLASIVVPIRIATPVVHLLTTILGGLAHAAQALHLPIGLVGAALAIWVARSSMVAGATGRVGTAIRLLTTPVRLLSSLLAGMPAAYTRAGAAAGVMATETQAAAAVTRRAASTLGPGVLTGRAASTPAAAAAAGPTGLLARARGFVGGIGGLRGAAGMAGRGAMVALPLAALGLSTRGGTAGAIGTGALLGSLAGPRGMVLGAGLGWTSRARSTGSGALRGAATGAALGAFGGPLGMLVGGGIGAIGGALFGHHAANMAKQAAAQTKLATRLRGQMFTADFGHLQALRGELASARKSGDVTKDQASVLGRVAAARGQQLAQRAAVSFTAGFNQVRGAKYKSAAGISNLLPDLAPMTAQMRDRGAKAMVALAAGLERNGRLPKGSTDKVIRQLTNRYGDLVPSLARDGMLSMRGFDNAIKRSRVIQTARGQIADIKKTWDDAPRVARITSTNAQRVFSAQMAFLKTKVGSSNKQMAATARTQFAAIAATARHYGTLAKEQGAIGWRDYARQMNQVFSGIRSGATDVFTSVTRLAQVAGAQALNSMGGGGGGGGGPARSRGGPQGLPGTGRRRGGRVFRAGGLVDVMLSPGEEVQHGGGSWMVPGARTAADTVHAQVPSGAAVITGHGQQMMAQGATVGDAIAGQMPHFRAGGKVTRGELARYDRRHTPFQIGSAPRSPRMPFRIARAVGEYMGASPGRAYQFAQIGRGEGGGGGDPYPGVYSNRPDDRGMGWLQMTPYAHGRNNWGAGMLASYRSLGGRMWEQGGGTVYNPFTSMRLAMRLGGGGLGPWFGTRYLTPEQPRESILAAGVKGHHLAGGRRRSAYDAGNGYRWHRVTQTRTVKGTPHAALGPVRIDRFNIGNYLSGNPADAFSTAYQAALEGPYRSLLAGRARNSTLHDQFDQILEASRIQMVTPEKQVKTRRWVREKGPPGPGRRARAARVAPSMSAARAVGLGRFDGLPVAKWIIPEARYARAHGWRGRITSGYRSHAHNVAQGRLYRSEHEGTAWPHGAIDFGGFTSGLGNKLAFMRAAAGYRGPKVRAPIGFRDDGHASGTGHRRGGIVRMRTGGRVDAARGAAMSALAASRSHAARAAAGRLFGHGQAATVTRDIFTARPAANLEVRGDLFHLAELIDGTIATHIRTTIAGLRRRVTQLSHGRRTGGKLAETAGLKAQIRALDRQLAGVAAPTFNGLVKRMHQVQGEIRKLARGGLTRGEHVQVNRLRAVLALMQTEAGRRVGNIVAAVAAQTTRLERQRTRFDLRLRRLNIPAESARGQDALAKLLAAQGKAMHKQVTNLRRARDRALKAGDRGTAKEINSQLDELNATVRETAVALIEAQRSAVLAAAQDIVDRADFGISMASGWGDIADNAAKLAGTADTTAGHQAHADYVTNVVIPAIDKKIAADTQAGQTARAIYGENSSQFRDAVLAWMGDIKSRQDAQLDAQGAIADNTAATADQLKQFGGQLSFGFGGQQFTDDLLNSGVGA